MSQVTHFKNEIKITQEMLNEVKSICYRNAPYWRGNFDFKVFGVHEGTNYGKLPPALSEAANQMRKLSKTKYTTAFVQKYSVGQYLAAHKDPPETVKDSLVLTFGDFEGAEIDIDGTSLDIKSGDVVLIPCTEKTNGRTLRGPTHSVSPVTSGVRYALVLKRTI